MHRIQQAQRERFSMILGMLGNLCMGVAGVITGVLANSSAVMLDGLFSMIGFISAFLGLKISRRIASPPDKFRPMGYAAEESLFTTFRALAILGLIMFAAGSAAVRIFAYAVHGEVSEFIFAPVTIYFAGVGLTCVLLWGIHYRNWRLTNRRSEILRLEARAALFDGVLTGVAAAGLISIYYGRDGLLAPVVPVGDSVVVLLLCLLVMGQFWKDFRSGIAELAGAAAEPKTLARARRAARGVLKEAAGCLRDFSLIKMGRSHLIFIYYDPGRPVLAAEVDRLQCQLTEVMRQDLHQVEVVLLISERGR